MPHVTALTSIPATLGRYQVLGHIASGGMADVFLARLLGPSGFERPVVIKRILPHLARRPEFVQMFLDEARIIAAIRHENVVQVQELVHDKDELFIVMEYLAGENVGGVVTRLRALERVLDPQLCAHALAEVCGGLHEAHELTNAEGINQEVVHRDISPQNIFVTYHGAVKILDFGIAKAIDRMGETQTGQFKGKFAYMAPEQCRNEPIDRRTDIFALGIVLYEITTGRRLFARENAMQAFDAICNGVITLPSSIVENYPEELERICMKALERDPAMRYATAADMRRDLVNWLQAVQALGMAQEHLAELMRNIFADRMAEKTDLLRKVRLGAPVSHIPTAEVSSGMVSFDPEAAGGAAPAMHSPNIATALAAPVTRATQETPIHIEEEATAKGVPPSSIATVAKERFAWGKAVLIACLVGGMAAGVWFFQGKVLHPTQDETTETTTPSNATPPTLPSQPKPQTGEFNAQEKNPSWGSTPTQTGVQIFIETTPVGASVILDGREQGKTPLRLSLPPSQVPQVLEIKKEGFEPLHRAIIANANHDLTLSLTPIHTSKPRSTKHRPSTTIRPTTRPSKGSGIEFERFD